jgi:hypothetical protein
MAVPSAEGCNVGCPIVLPLVCRILSAFACLWDALELYGLELLLARQYISFTKAGISWFIHKGWNLKNQH